MTGFKPFGMPSCKVEPLKLKFEEYGSIRLINYNDLSQDEAAKQMNVSGPTFTRIYNRALKLIARSFVEGKAMEIVGGNFEFDRDWYRCRRCYKLIQGLENHSKCKDCPAYGENELIRLA
jgi:predicted DNA-binding protein (UPF0251 family)